MLLDHHPCSQHGQRSRPAGLHARAAQSCIRELDIATPPPPLSSLATVPQTILCMQQARLSHLSLPLPPAPKSSAACPVPACRGCTHVAALTAMDHVPPADVRRVESPRAVHKVRRGAGAVEDPSPVRVLGLPLRPLPLQHERWAARTPLHNTQGQDRPTPGQHSMLDPMHEPVWVRLRDVLRVEGVRQGVPWIRPGNAWSSSCVA